MESKECELTLYTDKILSLQDFIYLCSSARLVADMGGWGAGYDDLKKVEYGPESIPLRSKWPVSILW